MAPQMYTKSAERKTIEALKTTTVTPCQPSPLREKHDRLKLAIQQRNLKKAQQKNVQVFNKKLGMCMGGLHGQVFRRVIKGVGRGRGRR